MATFVLCPVIAMCLAVVPGTGMEGGYPLTINLVASPEPGPFYKAHTDTLE